jgi:hypothetical protein
MGMGVYSDAGHAEALGTGVSASTRCGPGYIGLPMAGPRVEAHHPRHDELRDRDIR